MTHPLTLFSLLAFILLLAGFSNAMAEDGVKQGYFLVATPEQDNTPFTRSVIYITQAGDSGTYGLIVNRPTGITMEEVIPDTQQSRHAKDELFIGGPMHGRFLFLLTKNGKGDELHQVTQDIFFAAGRETISRMAIAGPHEIMRMYAGFTSWGPGQLESEVASGNWLIAPATTAQLFDDDTSDLWKELYELWKGSWI